MTRLPGFEYDATTKRAVLDGYVPGTKGKVRRRRTLDNVTRDQALAEWKKFRADLKSGRAITGPVTLGAFIDGYFDLIAAGLQESTRKTHRTLLKSHLLRYFGKTTLESITTVRVVDFATDMRNRKLSPSYINDAIRLLKSLLRQAVERDVIGEYPIKRRASADTWTTSASVNE